MREDADPALATVTLENAFVRLEPLALEHESALAVAAADGELWHLRVATVPEPGAMRAYIEKALRKQATGNSLAFAVRDLRDGAIVGTTRYYDFHPEVPRLLIGYTWYAASRQHTHVNTAAKLLLIDHALDALRCVTVGWEVDDLNTRSQHAVERLGAHRDGILRQHKRRRDGTLRDTFSYSITAAEWPLLRPRLVARLQAAG